MTTDDLLSKMTLTDKDIIEIERSTVGQSSNPFWFKIRKGRITASNFYRVYTKMESIKKDDSISCDSLLNSLINPTPLGHLHHIQQGSNLEQYALEKLQAVLADQGHKNVIIKPCGLFLDKKYPFLGASPDGIISCDCCNERLIEVKCPTTELASLPYLDNAKKLKAKSAYYGQVQGQLMITGIKESWFFIYYKDGECSLQLLKHDNIFCKKLLTNLHYFFNLYMAPQLLMRRKRKLM